MYSHNIPTDSSCMLSPFSPFVFAFCRSWAISSGLKSMIVTLSIHVSTRYWLIDLSCTSSKTRVFDEPHSHHAKSIGSPPFIFAWIMLRSMDGIRIIEPYTSFPAPFSVKKSNYRRRGWIVVWGVLRLGKCDGESVIELQFSETNSIELKYQPSSKDGNRNLPKTVDPFGPRILITSALSVPGPVLNSPTDSKEMNNSSLRRERLCNCGSFETCNSRIKMKVHDDRKKSYE